MVQYILTPWRDRRELLKVRQQFYPAPPAAASTAPTTAPTTPASAPATGAAPQSHQPNTSISNSSSSSNTKSLAAQHHAVARVSMWMQRGNCPHMVESTALLTAAILCDGESSGSAGTYAVRAAYAAAFSRFVTGLLDGHQDKQRKLSMYSVAKTIGLPATFVELRHQATHEQLPSLAKLRSAARKALEWIWKYYWRHLGADEPQDDFARGDAAVDGYHELVMGYLGEPEGARKNERRKLLDRLDEKEMLLTLAHIADEPSNDTVLTGALRLARDVLRRGQEVQEEATEDLDRVKGELLQRRDALLSNDEAEAQEGSGIGWAKYEGTWKPRPIGVA